MLIPSERTLTELRHSQFLVRLTMTETGTAQEAALVIKAPSLTLKFMIAQKTFSILLYRSVLDKRLAYIARIDEGSEKPLAMWSFVESDEELGALRSFVGGETCGVHLFNEASVNVCSATSSVVLDRELQGRLESATTDIPKDLDDSYEQEMQQVLDAINSGSEPRGTVAIASPSAELAWTEVFNHYVTNRLRPSSISIVSGNEGTQQEELSLWLIDELDPSGAIRNPQVIERGGSRELSDLLLTYSGGGFLFESKSLSIFDRDALPDRARLSRNVIKSSRKAVKQLAGACSNIRRGLTVTDIGGETVNISRRPGLHCVIVVPELSLLNECVEFGGPRLLEFSKSTAGFLQWLDPAELNTLAGNARYLSRKSKRTSEMMAFDALLFQRWTAACERDTPNFQFRVRVGPAPG